MFHSTAGLVHLLAALLAILTGTLVFLNTKGGLFHKQVGYVYIASMLTLNLTAFQVYHLTGKFGPFHWLAVMSLLGLTAGMIPVYLRKRIPKWIFWHYNFMSWSVVGLYAGFWAETFTRLLPMGEFWPVVIISMLVTAFLGGYLIRRNASRLPHWESPLPIQ
ncbi:DUF2306 domain-containing protein [Spirosoma koreense]